MGRFTDKVVVITGASRGLGRAIALAVGREGGTVVVTARSAEGCRRVADEIRLAGGQALAELVDIAEPTSIVAMVQRVLDTCGRIDVLVNNAAIFGKIDWIVNYPLDEWDRIFQTNIRGAFLTTRAVLPRMIAREGGKIVNIGAGVLDERVDLGCAAYCASKAALINFSRQLAAEVRRHGIVVHVIDPGGLDTGMSDEIKTIEAENNEFAIAQVVDPALRLRQPEEIMPMILFVLSDEANMLTGRFFQVSSKDSPRYLQL